MSIPLMTRRVARDLHSFDRQLHVLDLVRGQGWRFDLATGTLAFGNQRPWRTQLLGTESEASGTWLWAWANTAGNVPAHLLVASLALRAYGEEHGIPELTAPQLPLDRIDGHALALLASGVCRADGYYRCPYAGGTLVVLISDANFPACTQPPLQRVAAVFPQAIAALDIPDHRFALAGYLDHYRLPHEQADDRIVVRKNGEPMLTATFDERNRLTNLQVWLEATADGTSESSPGESWDEGQLRRMLGG